MENGHGNSGFSHEKWWFSIAMLVHQRVMLFSIFGPVPWQCQTGRLQREGAPLQLFRGQLNVLPTVRGWKIMEDWLFQYKFHGERKMIWKKYVQNICPFFFLVCFFLSGYFMLFLRERPGSCRVWTWPISSISRCQEHAPWIHGECLMERIGDGVS